jgi:hypothetical protein
MRRGLHDYVPDLVTTFLLRSCFIPAAFLHFTNQRVSETWLDRNGQVLELVSEPHLRHAPFADVMLRDVRVSKHVFGSFLSLSVYKT